MISDFEVAWFAGLFEGEGCIHIARNGNVRLTVSMTDRDIVDRIATLFPGPPIRTTLRPPLKPEYNAPKPLYSWNIGKPDQVKPILALILPWLGERRRAKALDALAHYEERLGVGGFNKVKTHCAQGHEYTVENTYVRPGTDHRHCRECMIEWAAAYQRRKEPGRGQRWRLSITHCPKGHPYTPGNVYVPPNAKRPVRICRECRRIYKADYNARKRLSL